MPYFNFKVVEEKKKELDVESKKLIENCVPLKGYEHNYVIDENGNIYSIKDRYGRNRVLKLKTLVHNGYETVMVCKNKKATREFVHRLVALSFIPNPNNYKCVNHKDKNKLNNHYTNLEWCTHQYNNNYSRNISQWNKDRGFDIEVIDVTTNNKYVFQSVREAVKFLHVDRFKFTKTINTEILYNNKYKSRYV